MYFSMLKNEEGSASSIVVSFIFFISASITIINASTMIQNQIKFSKIDNLKMSAKMIKNDTELMLRNVAAIENMMRKDIAKNNLDPMSCIIKGYSCEGRVGNKYLVPFVYRGNGDLWLDLSNSNTGLNMNGEPCSTFNVTQSGINTFDCTFRLEVYWEPVCANKNCTNYKSHFTTFLFISNSSFDKKIPINLGRAGYVVDLTY